MFKDNEKTFANMQFVPFSLRTKPKGRYCSNNFHCSVCPYSVYKHKKNKSLTPGEKDIVFAVRSLTVADHQGATEANKRLLAFDS